MSYKIFSFVPWYKANIILGTPELHPTSNSSFLLRQILGRQWSEAQVIGFLELSRETWIEFYIRGCHYVDLSSEPTGRNL